jgi:hypothetical protein
MLLLFSEQVVFFVDAPTSKVKIVMDGLKTVESMGVGKCAVFIPVGRRFDLLASVMTAAKRAFPKHSVFMIQCDAGATQSSRVVPTYAVYLPVPGPETSGVPTSVRVNSCKAKAFESLRLRCTDRACPKRPHGLAPTADTPRDALEELGESDVEDCSMEQYLDFEEEPDDDGVVMGNDEDSQASNKREYLVDLFPFGRPIAHYATILTQVCHAESAAHLAVVSRAGHPACLIAGRDCGLEVFALLHGVKPHGLAHGKELLENIMVTAGNLWLSRCISKAALHLSVRTQSRPYAEA